MRIAGLHFSHETITFLANDTRLGDFVYPGSPAAGGALLGSGPKSYMGGFVRVAREFDGVELVGIELPLWPRTGTGSGWVTNEAYDTFAGRMIAEIRATGPYDGVYLCLHGAMAVRGVPRPDADLARRVREAVGRAAFLAATFDPHGNEDEAFLQYADLAFTGKYFPHYDSHLQGQRAARCLHELRRDRVHRHAGAAEYRLAAEDIRVADDELTRASQSAKGSSQLTPRLAQINLKQAAFERDRVAPRIDQRFEHLAPQLRHDPVSEPPLKRE